PLKAELQPTDAPNQKALGAWVCDCRRRRRPTLQFPPAPRAVQSRQRFVQATPLAPTAIIQRMRRVKRVAMVNSFGAEQVAVLQMNPTKNLIRPLIRNLHAYVPGEQPKIKGLIKLNTNENPYPPSPAVLNAVQAAVDGRLRLYPNPTAQRLREKLANFHRCGPENIIVGNGSDELLAMATRAFVEPACRQHPAGKEELPAGRRQHVVQFFTPSYSLYPVLAAIHGADVNPVP